LRTLRALFASGTATGLTDDELLERYTARRAESAEAATAAEAAFAALVDRHGPMVWGVCRRVLGDGHEAEDAFQATFLVLVRRAGSVRVDGSLGRWLYGVAQRVALRARSDAARRASGIGRVAPVSSDDPVRDAELRDLRRAVAEELGQLPAKYRGPVELCDLQGMTYDEAARQLSWPVAAVKSRLARGRVRLRERLGRRALAPGAVGSAAAAALGGEARAAVPPELVRSTVLAAAPGGAAAWPSAVADLSAGVLKMMTWEKIKLMAAGALVAAGLTAPVLSQQTPGGQPRTPEPPATAAQPAARPVDKPAGDRRWVRSLPCGAIIEVVGISSFPCGPDTWWRPDGTPMRPAPCDPVIPSVSGDRGQYKAIVARLARIPDGAEHLWWLAEASGASGAPAKRNGQPLPGLYGMIVLVPADAGTGTLHFKVASGAWKTFESWGKNAGGVSGIDGSFIHSEPFATGDKTSLPITHSMLDKSVRIVALDGDGNELPPNVRSGITVKDFKQVVVEFDRPPDQIKGFRLQTRGYEEVEIPRIALKRK
jgi:RNA polymerase sigma factor (sigma-70 family)